MDLEIKLYYFGIAGKGEAIRLALKHAGIEFEDYKFADFDEFNKMKETGELMFGQVPALKVTNKASGKPPAILTQSAAILRFIAKISPHTDLYPKCPIQAARVDAILDQEADAFQSFRCCNYADRFGFSQVDEEVMKKCKEEINEKVIPKHFELLEKQLVKGGTGWLAGTEKPTIADFQWAGILPAVKAGWTGKKWDMTAYPKLNAMCDRFYEIESVKAWYENNKYEFWFQVPE